MQKSVQITLIIVAGIVFLTIVGYLIFNSMSSQNTVTVQGYSGLNVLPDLAVVYFNVETRGTTSEEATSKNSKIVENLTANLINEGFEKEDIQTQNFNVYPDYVYSGSVRKENGYVVTHSLKVEMPAEQTDKIGKSIDSGISAGAGVSYINFELTSENQNKYKAEAMKLAAEDATIKANSVAEGFGKKAGKLVSVSVNEWGYYPWIVYSGSGMVSDAKLAREASTTIQPSEQTITASVSAVFKIK